MSDNGWQPQNNPGGVLPAPTAKPQDPVLPVEHVPTPEEVAAGIAARQNEIDSVLGVEPQASPLADSEQSESPPVVITHKPIEVLQVQVAAPVSVTAPAREIPVVKTRSASPKYNKGAFVQIQGGFSGRVTKCFGSTQHADTDPDVQKAGGIKNSLRGINGTSEPSTQDQWFYLVVSNAYDYPLVVGELDCRMMKQG